MIIATPVASVQGEIDMPIVKTETQHSESTSPRRGGGDALDAARGR